MRSARRHRRRADLKLKTGLRQRAVKKQARSIKDQPAIAKLPLAKDVDDFAFKGTPINEALVRDLVGGAFIAQQRNVVLVGGTEPES